MRGAMKDNEEVAGGKVVRAKGACSRVSLLNLLESRQKRGTGLGRFRSSYRKTMRLTKPRLYHFSEVLPCLMDRASVVLLGFSRNGQHLIGHCTSQPPSLMLWSLTPNLQVSASKYLRGSDNGTAAFSRFMPPAPPALIYPLPLLFSGSAAADMGFTAQGSRRNGGSGGAMLPEIDSPSTSVELSVTQSADSRLLAVLVAPFPPPSDVSEQRSAELLLCPVPEEGARGGWRGLRLETRIFVTSSVASCSSCAQSYAFPSPTSKSHSVAEHYLVDLPREMPATLKSCKRHLLVINCGDVVRFLEIKVWDREGVSKNHDSDSNRDSNRDNTPHEDSDKDYFPGHLQRLRASSAAGDSLRWWCGEASLSWRACSTPLGGSLCEMPSDLKSRPGPFTDLEVVGETTFEAEPYLAVLLASQLRPGAAARGGANQRHRSEDNYREELTIADYEVKVVDPLCRPPRTAKGRRRGHRDLGGSGAGVGRFVLLSIVALLGPRNRSQREWQRKGQEEPPKEEPEDNTLQETSAPPSSCRDQRNRRQQQHAGGNVHLVDGRGADIASRRDSDSSPQQKRARKENFHGTSPRSNLDSGDRRSGSSNGSSSSSSSSGYGGGGGVRVGVLVALDWRSGDTIVLKSARLQPPKSLLRFASCSVAASTSLSSAASASGKESSRSSRVQDSTTSVASSRAAMAASAASERVAVPLEQLARRFAATAAVKAGGAAVVEPRRDEAKPVVLANSAVLRGTPLQELSNPVLPIVILQ